MAIDERLIRALHLRTMGRDQAADDPAAEHTAFQTSTIAALMDGAYDGEVSFAELRAHGDFGLGTFDGLDGELIALDGEFWRAAVDGDVSRVPGEMRTPFAVVTPFVPDVTVAVDEPLDHDGLLALAERHLPAGPGADALRFDGRFARVHARSVPRQRKPYPPLAEVARAQAEFTFTGIEGSLVGFRFPDEADGVEVTGYHLHFISADRARGGHVLRVDVQAGTLLLDRLDDLHLELPPGVELAGPMDQAHRDALRRAEGEESGH